MATATIESQWNGKEVKIRGNRVVGKSAFEIGLIVEAQAKALCPVDLGYLRSSITTQSFTQGSAIEFVPSGEMTQAQYYKTVPEGFKPIAKPTDENEVLVGTAVFYAPYVEFGTIRSNAQPFLRPALDLVKGRTLTVLEQNGRFEFAEYLQ